jgi:hypothetical protein
MRTGSNSTPIFDRFIWKFKVNLTTGCWEWAGTSRTGNSNSNFHGKGRGYGLIFSHKENGKPKVIYAHRFSYQYFVGCITNDKEIDHICNVPWCINPAHLRLVTHRENVILSHWHRGHILTVPLPFAQAAEAAT